MAIEICAKDVLIDSAPSIVESDGSTWGCNKWTLEVIVLDAVVETSKQLQELVVSGHDGMEIVMGLQPL